MIRSLVLGSIVDAVLHVLVLLAVPPLLQGVIVKTKARFGGRVGAPVLQPYFDLAKLLRKEMVISRTTSWVFLAGPAVTLTATVSAALLLPFGGMSAPVHFAGDLVLFAYLLALGRFFTAAAALDTGSAFEGMGAAREVTFACLAEPAMFLGLLALVKLSGSLELSQSEFRLQCEVPEVARGQVTLPGQRIVTTCFKLAQVRFAKPGDADHGGSGYQISQALAPGLKGHQHHADQIRRR